MTQDQSRHAPLLCLLTALVLCLVVAPTSGAATDASQTPGAGRSTGSLAVDSEGTLRPDGGDSTAAAGAVVPSRDGLPTGGLKWIDWLIIVMYAAATIGLGWYFSRRQKTTQEYFIGSGRMSPWLIGTSLFATLLSTITYLSRPGEMIGKGPAAMATLVSLPLAYLIVANLLIPVYMRHRVTSAYELLESRLGVGIRVLGAAMFLVLRLVWMSLLVYLAAKAMTVMIGVDAKWIPLIVLVTGFVAVIYTSLGGLQAVVMTDLLQSLLLLGGAVLVLVTVSVELGGFGWFPTSWQPNWDRQPLFSIDPKVRLTIVGTIVMQLTWNVCTAGGDQTAVQRFMATGDAASARRAYLIQLVWSGMVTVTLSIVGLALLGYFQTRADVLHAGMSLTENADDIFPHYIAYHLPPGVSGLVVAAMFAAAMSSIDSGVNSITAVLMTDFLERFGMRPRTRRGHVRVAKLMAFSVGAIVVVGSSFMEHVPGNITAVTAKTNNLLVTPIFALFFFALFVPFATPVGVLIGAIAGTATASLIAFSGPIFGMNPVTGGDPVSFQWIGPASLLVNLAVGSLASLLLPRGRRET